MSDFVEAKQRFDSEFLGLTSLANSLVPVDGKP